MKNISVPNVVSMTSRRINMNGKRAKALRAGVGFKLKHWRKLHPKDAYNIEKHQGGLEPDRWIAYQLWCKGQKSWYKKAKQMWYEQRRRGGTLDGGKGNNATSNKRL
jgi:hypothetical protein